MSPIQLAGCAVKGPKHEEADLPCQDAWFGHQLSDSQGVIAVGDGLGSASHSDEGSQRATEELADALRDSVSAHDSLDEAPMEEIMKKAFRTTREGVIEAAADIEQPLSELHTTLLGAVIGPSGAAVAATGDGGIVGRRDGENFLMIPREDTEYGNVTTPVTSNHWQKGYRYQYHDAVEAVAVFTDGIDPFAWSQDAESAPRDELFDQLFEMVESRDAPEDVEAELRSFLDSEHFRRYKSDDKTLAVGGISQPEQETAAGSPRRRVAYLRRLGAHHLGCGFGD